MSKVFANRVDKLQPAAVYEIVKRVAGTDIVRLFVGNPGSEAIPTAEIAKIAADILSKGPSPSLEYGPTEGYPPLRKHLKEQLSEDFGIGTDDDEVIVTSGGTQAIELCARVFCDDGDTVVTENPTFVGTLGTFNGLALNIIGVDMQTDGMDLDKLEEVLSSNKNVRFVYVIPSFHNPTSWTMTLEKRKRLYDMAVKHGVMLVEDDAYRDLCYTGKGLPTLKSMDTKGIVLYCGSFSKTISPGLRVGYLVANKKFIAKLAAAKQVADVHTPCLSQMIVYEFMTKYNMKGHIEHIREIYKEKLQIAMDEIKIHLGDKISYVVPEGGLYLYCKLPEHIDVKDFYQKGIDAGVAIVYGSAFYVDPEAKSPYFRINFSSPSKEDLRRGIKILGEVLKLY